LVEFLLVVAGGLVSLGTTLAMAHYQRRLDRQDHQEDRVRDHNLRRINETRMQLVSMLDGIAAALDKDSGKAQRLLAQADDQLFANARLVGDVEALAAAAEALVRIQLPVREHPVAVAVQLAVSNPWSQEDRDALRDARTKVLSALEQQQERALRDEPLVVLSTEQIRGVPALADPHAAVAAAKANARATQTAGRLMK
jgi:hypothetical protein